MNSSYIQQFKALEDAKANLLSILAQSDEDDLKQRVDLKWSPLEHCYHVYLAEKLSRMYCEKKLSFDPVLKKAGFLTKLRLWGLKIIELVPLKFKAPQAINQNAFPEHLSLEMVADEWEQERKALNSFLDKVDPKYHDKELFKQPLAGRLTIGGMLEFFLFHLQRHQSHIKTQYKIG